MSAIDQLVEYVTTLLENSGGASESPEDIRADLLPIVSLTRTEAIREVAVMADPAAPEVSFFGIYGPQVAAWMNQIAQAGERP